MRLSRLGETVRNKMRMKITVTDAVIIAVMLAALTVVPAYTEIVAWKLLAAYAVTFILAAYLFRLAYRRGGREKSS